MPGNHEQMNTPGDAAAPSGPQVDSIGSNAQLTVNPADAKALNGQINSFLQSSGISSNDPNALSAYFSNQAAQDQSGGLFAQIIGTVIIGVLTAGAGAAAAAGIAGAVGATAGSAAGIASSAAGYGVAGAGISAAKAYGSGQDIGTAALKGGISGAIGGAITGGLGQQATQAVQGATGFNPQVAAAIAKGGLGAASSAITGGNPLTGAISQGLGSAIGSGATDLGASAGVAGALGKIGGGIAANAASSPSNNNNVQAGIAAGTGVANTVGNMAVVNPSTNGIDPTQAAVTSGGSTLGGALQTGVGLGSTLLGTIGSAQAGSAVGNVLSNAQAGTGVGTNTSYAGPNSTGSIASGQVSSQLSGGLNLANTGLGNVAAGSAALAGQQNGQLPSNVAGAINQQATTNSALPQGTQGQLTQQSNLQGQVQNSQLGLINQGTSQLNNPLTGNLQSAAQTQLSTAGQDFNTTYNNSLASLNAALVNPTQNAEAELANTQFGRGQLGTSGGALQTQAFATGLGQAYLGNQQTAFNEATNAQNSATTNAATLNNSANNNLSTANSLLANAYGQFNNTSQLNTNTANSIYGQNANISQLANQYGQQNVGNQITAAQLPASLTGQNIANSNAAISGASNLTGIANSGTSAALAAGTQQGQQYNTANAVSGQILNSSGFAQTGGNPYGAIGAGLTAALGSNGVASGIGSALNGIGGGGSTNLGGASSPSQLTDLSADGGALQTGALNASAPSFDFSNIGGVSNTDYDYGDDGGDY